MKMSGELTALIAEKISADWENRGFDVFYDHGKKGNNKVGKIVSWFGDAYKREAELSQLDIAIAEKGSGKIFALIEIEETTDNPKTLIGDSFGALMGERIMFAGKRELSIDKNTILIVLGQSKIHHQVRNNHIQDRVMEMKSHLSTANSEIGRVIIDSFADADELDALLLSVLDRAFKGEL